MKHIHFIINPLAGGQSKDEFIEMISSVFEKDSYDIVFTESQGHAKQLAMDSNADIIVAVGGDGTINEVASGLVNTDKTLGIIPYGSGNGLARHLGIDMSKHNALEIIKDGHIETIDYGTVNDHLFFCTCGVGLDAEVSMRFSQEGHRGLLTYLKSSLYVWKDFKPEAYDITIDGQKFSQEANIITIGNANQWGNNAYITPNASLCDGLFDIAIVEPFSTLETANLGISLMTKNLGKMHKVHYFRGENILIHRSTSGCVHFDGEPAIFDKDIKIKMHKKGLKVICPKYSDDHTI